MVDTRLALPVHLQRNVAFDLVWFQRPQAGEDDFAAHRTLRRMSAKSRTGTSPRVKLEAVERVLQGDSIESVATALGIDPEHLGRWHTAFMRAGKAALRYTGDPGEVPSLRDIQQTAQKAFPTRILNGCRSAASFFVAQFYGKNDVIHIYNAGIAQVTLVDLDVEKLGVMRDIYPDDWEVLCEDAFAAARRFREGQRTFDVVTCDAYSGGDAETVAWTGYPLWESLAGKYLLLMYSASMLEQLHAAPEPASVAEALNRRLDRVVRVVDLIKRSSHAGGIYWCVIDTSR